VTLVERRIGLLFAIVLLLMLVAGLRSFQIGVLQRPSLVNAAASQQVLNAQVPARRGTITDRRGDALAVSEPADDVSATPYLVKDPAAAARKLAPLLKVPEADLLAKLARTKTAGGQRIGFVYLARKVPSERSQQARKLKIEGIDFASGYRRIYPNDSLASQVLGVVGLDGDGKSGLEYSQEERLHGVDGKRNTVRDGVGDSVQVRDTVKTVPGARLELTLDARIQDEVEQVLKGIGATYRPKGATALVMDPRNGEILAMANWPRINANKPSDAPSYANQNRAVGYNYEPGSTFKAFTVAAALEEKTVTPSTVFDLPPTITLYDRTIGEAHPRPEISLPVSKILAQSSNVGAVKIGLGLGNTKLDSATKFDKWVRRFGFGKKTGVDLPGEQQGIMLDLDDYSGSSMGNLPIGQGMAVTPIQMAQAYTAIANGGILRPPHMIRAVDGERTAVPAGRRVISQKTSVQLRTMLKGVFAAGGTAQEVSIPGYEVAGKTGTAQKIDKTTGEYSDSRYVSSFIGFAPARDPRLLISLMVDEPQGVNAGGAVAAPGFGKIASFALPYLGIPPR
jgi:cell division protein FtsI/penicillin-binding protein 2